MPLRMQGTICPAGRILHVGTTAANKQIYSPAYRRPVLLPPNTRFLRSLKFPSLLRLVAHVYTYQAAISSYLCLPRYLITCRSKTMDLPKDPCIDRHCRIVNVQVVHYTRVTIYFLSYTILLPTRGTHCTIHPLRQHHLTLLTTTAKTPSGSGFLSRRSRSSRLCRRSSRWCHGRRSRRRFGSTRNNR